MVVVAHYDSVYTAPGANDNAASLACLGALALRLREVPEAKRPAVHFLATGAEECGLQGARCYVRDLQWRGEAIPLRLALNFDSLTWGDTLKLGTNAAGAVALPAFEAALAATRLSAYTGAWEREPPTAGVDSAPFFSAGIPTLNVNSAGDPQTVELWHTPADTEERVPWPRVDVWHHKVPAGAFVLNGTGEMTGLAWVSEAGFLEYPVALTSTLNLPRVANGVIGWMVKRYPDIGISDDTLTPVVAECDDSRLNDSRGPDPRPGTAEGGMVPGGVGPQDPGVHLVGMGIEVGRGVEAPAVEGPGVVPGAIRPSVRSASTPAQLWGSAKAPRVS